MRGLAGRGLAPRFGLRLPVVQAPMAGGITTVDLVAAVCEAGALGSLAAAMLSPARIVAEVGALRARTDRPFAVNLFVFDPPASFSRAGESAAMALLADWRARYGLPPQTSPQTVCEPFLDQLDAVIALAPPVVSFHFGLPPAEAIRALKAAGSRIVGTATQASEARAWAEAGADAVVAQSLEAGGHQGCFDPHSTAEPLGLFALLPAVRHALTGSGVAVIAAGGLMAGADIAAALTLGADGVQLGTAFLATRESGAPEHWKAALAEGETRGTRLTRAFSGRRARGLVNDFMNAMQPHEASLPVYPVQNALTAELRAAATRAGDIEAMSLWAGQSAARARAMPAAHLLQTMEDEFEAALAALMGDAA